MYPEIKLYLKITMLENVRYITELTARHCYQSHMSGTHVGETVPLFQADA